MGTKGSRDLELYKGDHLTSWDIRPGYGTFFFPYAWNILQEGVNQNEEGSLATDDIRLFVTINQPTVVPSDSVHSSLFLFYLILYFSYRHSFFLFPALSSFTNSSVWILLLFNEISPKIFKFFVKLCTFVFTANVDLHCKEASTYLWGAKKVQWEKQKEFLRSW